MSMAENIVRLLTRRQVAERLGVKPNTLAVWACRKMFNLPYVKVGRSVRYHIEDLEKWLAERKVNQQNDAQEERSACETA